MSAVPKDPWLTTEEFAARMRVDPATIRSWRRAGYGPPAVKFGAKRLYRESAVIAWEAEREREAIEEARADRERSAPP